MDHIRDLDEDTESRVQDVFFICTKVGLQIEGPHSEEGYSQVLEGPHRDRGHIMQMVQLNNAIMIRYILAIQIKLDLNKCLFIEVKCFTAQN